MNLTPDPASTATAQEEILALATAAHTEAETKLYSDRKRLRTIQRNLQKVSTEVISVVDGLLATAVKYDGWKMTVEVTKQAPGEAKPRNLFAATREDRTDPSAGGVTFGVDSTTNVTTIVDNTKLTAGEFLPKTRITTPNSDSQTAF